MTAAAVEVRLHATAVSFGNVGVLIRGPSGAGKSDLALRLLAFDVARAGAIGDPALEPALLVSDDQVCVALDGADLVMTAPATIRGKLEVRGLGIIDLPTRAATNLRLVLDLVEPGMIERLPDPAFATVLERRVPSIRLEPFEASAPMKAVAALAKALRADPGAQSW